MSLEEKYDEYIDLIKLGMVEYEKEARTLIAENQNLSLDSLENALKIGYKKVFEIYIRLISEGDKEHKIRAARLIHKYGFPVESLEAALDKSRTISLNDKARLKELIEFSELIEEREIINELKAVLNNFKDIS
ncbi:hypothetical protein HY498_01305 [Candidatus Woesearchaeota archaeon]|nr:hypothetical protein [Candidatus Woesearchaeota archaeon]MBI4154703.1 hypothetical protein [Candidatus Woesearchaeota archaeon]